MAYRRYGSSRGRSYSSRFRSSFRRARTGSRLSSVHRPIRWERGNFYLEFLHLHADTDRLVNTVVPIAMVNNLIVDASDEGGRTLSEMTRALEIGGLKFTCVQNLISLPNIRNLQQEGDPFDASSLSGSSSMMADSKILLVSDALVTDPSDGLAFPQAIESNFFTNTMPVTRVQEVQDIQSLYPRRIHWQNFKQHNAGFQFSYPLQHTDPEDQARGIFGNQDQQVNNSHSGGNLRLRLRLQDDECLAWFFTSFLNRSETLATFAAEVNFKVTGTIWYRYRF